LTSKGRDLAWRVRVLVAQRAILVNQSRDKIMKTISTFVAVALLAVLAGCNTVEGAGKDVKATGAAVEKAADQSKPK
jgi:predicted small secreted protein